MFGKSVVLDIADNHDYTEYAAISIRSIEFFLDGTLVTVLDNHNYYATTKQDTSLEPEFAFNTSLSKTGTSANNAWASLYNNYTNQRLILVFNSSTEFNKIVVNNGHNLDGGANTGIGAKNVKITISSDAITDTTYNATVANSEVIFNGVFDEHVVTDIEDPQTVWMEPEVGVGSIVSPLASVSGISAVDIIGAGVFKASASISSVGQSTIVGWGRVAPKHSKIYGNYGSVGNVVAPLSTIESYGLNTIMGTGDIEIQSPNINSFGQVSSIGTCNLSIDKPNIDGYGEVLNVGIGQIKQPLNKILSYGYITSFGVGSIEVPVPKLSGVDTISTDYTIIRYTREGQCL
jgi:hypothetical protein